PRLQPLAAGPCTLAGAAPQGLECRGGGGQWRTRGDSSVQPPGPAGGLWRSGPASDPAATARRQAAGLCRSVQRPARPVRTRPAPGKRPVSPRLAAANALALVMAGKASLGTSLPPQLAQVAPRDQALARELAFGTARWDFRLQGLAEQLLQKPLKAADRDIHALLLVGIYQLLYTRIPGHAAISETVDAAVRLKKAWAKGLLNAVLRRVQREGNDLLAQLERDPVIRTAHPRWLQKRLKADWPDHWEPICAANNLHPPMTLRVNRLPGTRDPYLTRPRAAKGRLARRARAPVTRPSHPRRLPKRLKAGGPEHGGPTCPATNLPPPMTLRVNRLRGTRDRYLTRLREAGIEASPCRFSVR